MIIIHDVDDKSLPRFVARLDRAEVFYWRTATGKEVDFVIEAGGRLPPGLACAMRRICARSALNMGTRLEPACCCTPATTLEWLAPDVLAAPWWTVL